MDLAVPPELEELIICSCCHSTFNDSDAIPKLFTCRHYFCLKCVNSLLREGSNELYCILCWKRTELQGPEPKTDCLPTYKAIIYLAQNFSLLSLRSKATTNFTGGVTRIGLNGLEHSGSDLNKQRSSSIASIGSNGQQCNGSNGNLNSLGSSCSISSNGNPPITSHHSNGNLLACSNGNDHPSSTHPLTNLAENKVKVGENCMTHAMPNTLWCSVCNILLCRACAATEEHRSHLVKNKIEAKETLHADISNELVTMQNTICDLQHLVLKQRDFLLKILESCTTLKTQIETELVNHLPTLEIAEMRESLGKARLCMEMIDKQTPTEALKLFTTLRNEKQRLLAKHHEMFLQCKLDDLIRNCGYVFDFDLIKQALLQLHNRVLTGTTIEALGAQLNGFAAHHNPVLLLANYCISQLYSRHMLIMKQQEQQKQQQQQNQRQLLGNGLISSIVSQSGGVTGVSAHTTTYAQALQQNQQPVSSTQQQQHGCNIDEQDQKSYADLASTNVVKSNLQQQLLLHQHQQQQQNQVSSFPELAPIGTPASGLPHRTGAHLFGASNEINNLGLSLLQLQHRSSPQLQQRQHQLQQQLGKSSLLVNPSVHVYPIYFFNIEINGQHAGRILIEVRSDVAPKMAKNFNALTTHEMGYGYKGCHIFQCWENESIITGDFELNNGRGGRSVYDEGFFMPDDTKILAIRGSVGMRRSQKRHDNLGLVGSQFRIILREMRGFTGIFAFVVEGLDLVEKISQTGDATGKPQSSVLVNSCGKYQMS